MRSPWSKQQMIKRISIRILVWIRCIITTIILYRILNTIKNDKEYTNRTIAIKTIRILIWMPCRITTMTDPRISEMTKAKEYINRILPIKAISILVLIPYRITIMTHLRMLDSMRKTKECFNRNAVIKTIRIRILVWILCRIRTMTHLRMLDQSMFPSKFTDKDNKNKDISLNTL